MSVPLHDKLVAAVILVLLVGVLALTGLRVPIPEYLVNAFTLALGWLFRGGIQAANEYLHRNQGS